MGGSKSHSHFLWKNRPKTALVVYHDVFCLDILLKVVSYYDFSVLSKSLMACQKKIMVGGWGEQLYPVLFWIF